MNGIKSNISPHDALLQKKVEELKRSSKNPKKLQKAAKDFEALFLQYMLKSMRKTIIKSGLLDTGLGGEIYEGLFDTQLAQKMAHDKSLGIADILLKQLSSEEGAEALRTESLRSLPLRRNLMKLEGFETYQQAQLRDRLKPYEKHIQHAAIETGVDASLIGAVIMAESGGNAHAVSPKNAKGLMQLLDTTAVEVKIQDPFDPAENVKGGARYLAKMLKKFNGDTRLALAAYNAGPDAVEKYNNVPPYQETQSYINKVQEYFKQLREMLFWDSD